MLKVCDESAAHSAQLNAFKNQKHWTFDLKDCWMFTTIENRLIFKISDKF